MSSYAPYYLRDNPFPETAVVDPYNDDIRINGTIFNEEIFKDRIDDLQKKLNKRTNMIYITGGGFARGTGKSALLTYEWRNLQGKSDVSSIYVPKKKSVQDIAFHIISELHGRGYLWLALQTLIEKYAEKVAKPMIPLKEVERFKEAFPSVPKKVPLEYFYVFDFERFVDSISEFVLEQSGLIVEEVLKTFLTSYLSKPLTFLKNISKLKVRGYDDVDYLKSILEILNLADFEYNYFFFDQLEWAIEKMVPRDLYDFVINMRRLLEACINKASIIVTLHPSAEMLLKKPEYRHLTSLAPLDGIHIVNLSTLDYDDAIDLTLSYAKRFREGVPPDTSYPFDESLIKYISFIKNGIPRDILEALHHALEEGVEAGYSKIDIDFVRQRHEKITGTIFREDKFKEFEKHIGL